MNESELLDLGKKEMLLLIICLLLIFGGGGGYAYNTWPQYGGGIGLGTVLIIVVLFLLLRGSLR
jgi:hypothetical protein